MIFWKENGFEQNIENKISVWKILGFLIGYTVFTGVLFFITTWLNKFPQTWGSLFKVWTIIAITAGIVFLGAIIGGNFTKKEYKTVPQVSRARNFIFFIAQEFKSGINQFGKTITSFINGVLLTIVYVVGVGMTSLAAKITKKKFLNIEQTEQTIKKSTKETYWQDLNLTKQDLENYYRQF